MPSGAIGEHHAHDGVPVLAELGIRLELDDGAAGGGHVDREGHRCPWWRNRPGRSACRRDSCRTPASPRRPAAAPSAAMAWREPGPGRRRGTTAAAGRCDWRRAPPARQRQQRRSCAAAAPVPAAAPRGSRRAGLRQMTTGVALGAGCDVGEQQVDLLGARRRRPAAAAPAARAQRIGEVMGRLGLQRRVVEGQRALVAGAAGGQIAAGKEPARPGRQILLNLVAAGARLGQGGLEVGGRRRQALSSDSPSRAWDIPCSPCSPPSRCGRRNGR